MGFACRSVPEKVNRLITHRWLLGRLALAASIMFFVVGCATDPTPMGSRFVVSAPFAEFYKNGPAQDTGFAQHTFANYQTEQVLGPDFQLPKGASVTMLKRESGYSKVVTDNGVAGYVSNDKLQPAPAVARAAAAATELRPVRNYRERTRALPPSRKNEDQLDYSDLPLPLPS